MSILRKSNLAEPLGRLGKTNSLLIWAGLVVIFMFMEAIRSLWTGLIWTGDVRGEQLANITLFFFAISLLHFFIINPWVVGFTYTFMDGKEQKLAISDGVLRGAFAALAVSGIEIIMGFLIGIPSSIHQALQFRLEGSIGIIGFVLLPALVQGAIAGVVAVLWRNKNQEKKIKEEIENPGFQNGENEQNERSEVVRSGKADENNILFYSAYIFILLGTATTLGLMIYQGYWSILSGIFLLLVGPSVQALIVSIIFWKFYNNHLSGVAVLLAALVFFFVSILIILFMPPLTTGMSYLPLFSILFASAGYIFTLIAVFVLGRRVKFLDKEK